MKAALCLKSEAVVKAFRTGQWPDSLRAHIESCECCRETFRVASAMVRMAERIESLPGELPDPELMRLKARIGRRSRLPARAVLPLAASAVAGAAGAGLVLTTISESVWNLLREWRPDDLMLLSLLEFPGAAAVSWWVPLVAVLLLLYVFTVSEVF